MTEHSDEIVYVEWDEPGAGGIVVNGQRIIHFNVETDWSNHWNPQVNPDALAFLDRLPRLVQERELAYLTAQECAEDLQALLKETGHPDESVRHHFHTGEVSEDSMAIDWWCEECSNAAGETVWPCVLSGGER